jgi:hypothetical protein
MGGARRGDEEESFVHRSVEAIRLSDALRLTSVSSANASSRCSSFTDGRSAGMMRAPDATLRGRSAAYRRVDRFLGAIIAFVGSVQLAQFGATIYVADMAWRWRARWVV